MQLYTMILIFCWISQYTATANSSPFMQQILDTRKLYVELKKKIEQRQTLTSQCKQTCQPIFSFASEHDLSSVKYTQIIFCNFPVLVGKYESILASETGLREASMQKMRKMDSVSVHTMRIQEPYSQYFLLIALKKKKSTNHMQLTYIRMGGKRMRSPDFTRMNVYLTYMSILKDHPNRVQLPQNLLKPKFIS